jgi:hypothetical protein
MRIGSSLDIVDEFNVLILLFFSKKTMLRPLSYTQGVSACIIRSREM